ncbi:MAG: type II/IV secretion system protein, partial [Alphaproteobacteria bacterium]|nr:type II/IV secretion system protein [Alphaproteobacteria bacterium]
MVMPSNDRLITLLLSQGILTPNQIGIALEEQKHKPRLLQDILIDLKLIDSFELQKLLSVITGHPIVDLGSVKINTAAFSVLPREVWAHHKALAFDWDGSNLCIALADPEDIVVCDSLQHQCQATLDGSAQIVFYHADPAQIECILHNDQSTSASYESDGAVEIVDTILESAVFSGASDIHFQPEEKTILVRVRIDGILSVLQRLHKSIWPNVSVRLKVMGQLDIAESRRPQSGRFDQKIAGHEIDFRLSTHPTIFGENIVIRILERNKPLLSLAELGFNADQIDYLKKVAHAPQGLIVVSGPTGSGKTTTLYGLFSQMDCETRNIMTLEEPVEYQLSGIRQTEIREGGVIDFADGVRSILRQDPDVIFIGEIRDEATAKMALRSAMTGHLVIATLHTYDSYGVPARLIDLGLQPALLSGNILCALSQRLVRKICLKCQGKGCEACHTTGYKGRTAIVEILPFDEGLDDLVAQGGNRTEILRYE